MFGQRRPTSTYSTGSIGSSIPSRTSVQDRSLTLPSVNSQHVWIELLLLGFETLTKFTLVEIELVESLCRHLEFDKQRKVLELFRLPSTYVLMCCGEKMSPLSQYVLFHNYIIPKKIKDIKDFEELLMRFEASTMLHTGTPFKGSLNSITIQHTQQPPFHKFKDSNFGPVAPASD